MLGTRSPHRSGCWLTSSQLANLVDMSASSTTPPDGAATVAERFTPTQKIAMAVLLTANSTLAVDFSILNVALPHTGAELDFATSAL